MISNLEASRRYRFLAYLVVRDAIGFYFGIPKFLEQLNKPALIDARLRDKLSKHPNANQSQIERYTQLIQKSIDQRLNSLNEDLDHAKHVLFTDNLWLQWLDIDTEFFQVYLAKLPPHMVDKIAVIPNWTTRDDSLRRPYLSNERSVREIKF